MLASSDPGVLKQLILSIDVERMTEMMGNRTVEELAAMMEEQEEQMGDDEHLEFVLRARSSSSCNDGVE